MRTIVTLATLALALPAGAPAQEEATREGAFVVRLGTDTTAVERFRRTPERLEATAVTRSPRTRIHELSVEFDAGGDVRRWEETMREAGPDAPGPVERRLVVDYGPDEVGVEAPAGERRFARPEGDFLAPFRITFQSVVEEAVVRALGGGGAEVHVLTDLEDGEASSLEVHRVGGDSVAIETPGLGTWRARVDGQGRILGMAAGALNTTVERVEALDVEEAARRYATLDAQGRGMGPLSPRDTVRARIGEASFEVDYGRPGMRGREIFGGLVPWGEVWRTGANQATHLTVDRPVRIESAEIPAGTYTVYTIPDPEGWTLIINRQTGQAGTEYDPAQDVARIPMSVEPRDLPTERFTISLVETGPEQGLLEMLWDRVRAFVPVRSGG